MRPLHTPDDVVARLRDASAVPNVRFDTPAVLATVRNALRRRRRRQAFVGVAAAGLLALTVSGPMLQPGVDAPATPGGNHVHVEDPGEPARTAERELRRRLHESDAEPSPEKMAEEVASLQTHVLPVLEELKATWYLDDDQCDSLQYPRGAFSDGEECEGQPFDEVARADLDKILDAVDRSGVPTDRLLSATYAPDGTVESAEFHRSGGGIEWYFEYRYSTDERPEQRTSPLGPVTLTPIGHTGWWFEKSPDD